MQERPRCGSAPSSLGELSSVTVDGFRRHVGFLGVVGIAFTCTVYLMIALRLVLEPFLWALFLVMALDPLSQPIEGCLLCAGQFVFGFAAPTNHSSNNRHQPSRRSWRPTSSPPSHSALEGDDQDISLSSAPEGIVMGDDDNESGDIWRLENHEDVESFCSSCCKGISRVIAVGFALAVVSAALFGLSMLIFDGALRVKNNFAIYEQGARDVIRDTKVFVARIHGRMPEAAVDEITEHALVFAKGLVSGIMSGLFSHAGMFMVEFMMIGLYVMFWLCDPMPLNTSTERIFRRYLFLKGSACICYGICAGLMFYALDIELAVVFGLLSTFFAFIPEVGVFIAILLPVPVILFDSRLESPFLTLLIATSGQVGLKFVFANIIEVKLVEHDSTMKMHPVITLLAVTFFGFIWGATGMLLSVPLMAYVKVLICSDLVPSEYRDPVLIMLEGDRRAPERLIRRRHGN